MLIILYQNKYKFIKKTIIDSIILKFISKLSKMWIKILDFSQIKNNVTVLQITNIPKDDSVSFMRELSKMNILFLLRLKNSSKLYFPKEEIDIKQG